MSGTEIPWHFVYVNAMIWWHKLQMPCNRTLKFFCNLELFWNSLVKLAFVSDQNCNIQQPRISNFGSWDMFLLNNDQFQSKGFLPISVAILSYQYIHLLKYRRWQVYFDKVLICFHMWCFLYGPEIFFLCRGKKGGHLIVLINACRSDIPKSRWLGHFLLHFQLKALLSFHQFGWTSLVLIELK